MWACLVEGFNTLATAGVLNLPDKRVDPGCWLRSGFESPRRQLVVNLFWYFILSGYNKILLLYYLSYTLIVSHIIERTQISYGRFTEATLYVPCLDWGLINYIHFPSIIFPYNYTSQTYNNSQLTTIDKYQLCYYKFIQLFAFRNLTKFVSHSHWVLWNQMNRYCRIKT